MTNSFNEYMEDLLLEQLTTKEMRLLISPRFRSFLETIDHPIAKDILSSSLDNDTKTKDTFVDLDDNKLNSVTCISVPKAMALLNKEFNKEEFSDVELVQISKDLSSDVYKKNRIPIKINKFVEKLFPNKYKPSGDFGSDRESFVNMVIAKRDPGNFELVEGEDIVKYYNEENYGKHNGGSLSTSCMRGGDCENYIEFYAKNKGKVSLLILKDSNDKTKIRGRAIVWDLTEPEDRIFMDRIYTFDEPDFDMFKNYAKTQGWLYKYKQNMSEDEKIVDTRTGEITNIDFFIDGLEDNDEYPYMDTMKFFNNGKITNDSGRFSEYYKLEDTNGGYEDSEGRIYVDFYGESYDEDELNYCDKGGDWRLEDDCYYSDFYGETIANDYAEDNMTECDYYEGYYDKYRENGDYTEIERYNIYVANDYLENNEDEFTYSEYDNDYLKTEDAQWSEYHSSYIYDGESVEVYLDADMNDSDHRVEGDSNSFEYDGEEYDEDADGFVYSNYEKMKLKESEAVEVYLNADMSETDWRGDDDDDDGNYFEYHYDGEYYDEDADGFVDSDYHEGKIKEEDSVEVKTKDGTDWRINDTGDGNYFEYDDEYEYYDKDDFDEDKMNGDDDGDDGDDTETELYSEYHGEDLDKDEAIKVFTSIDANETDWRKFDDKSFFKFNDKFYDNSVDLDELKEKLGEQHTEVDEYEDTNADTDEEYIDEITKDGNQPSEDDIPEEWEEALNQNESVMSLTRFSEFMDNSKKNVKK